MKAEYKNCHGTTGEHGVTMPDGVTYFGPVWTDDRTIFYITYRNVPRIVRWNAQTGRYVLA